MEKEKARRKGIRNLWQQWRCAIMKLSVQDGGSAKCPTDEKSLTLHTTWLNEKMH